jgi:hypothetical protein
MKSSRWFMVGLTSSLALAVVAALLMVLEIGSAQSRDSHPDLGNNQSYTSTLDRITGPLSLTGSSVSTQNCYEPGKTQTLCFTVYNGSTDAEWLDSVRLTFPQALGDWAVSCNIQDAVDSSGNPVHLTCSNSFNYELLYLDNDIETPTNIGEISSGSSWGFCVDATIPGAYEGPRIINWGLSGDEEAGSAAPHDIVGTLEVPECTPLMLTPSNLSVEGCNGISQAYIFDLWNNTGSDGTFDLSYYVPEGNATLSGPSSFYISAGGIVTFTVEITPNLRLNPGDVISANLQVLGNSQFDQSTIVESITALSGWESGKDSPIPSMDNVVVWASEEDGGLWSIGGYGSKGATQRYDPESDTWSTHTPETTITPTIEYPMDGCYGLNGSGDEIIVLFPDTLVTDTLHIFDITQDSWYTESIPSFYPSEGRWSQDVVSLLNNPSVKPGLDKNACYLSGGSTQTGGGRTRDLWVYYPDTNSGSYLGNFPAAVWFDFHASWYVPWVGNKGSICVGGGIDHKSQINDTTQCYDLATNTFRGLNADLGPLPEPWWGMADGWQIYNGQYQIWIANGVDQFGKLLPASAYMDATTGGFVPGPDIPVSLDRLEGDGWNGQFYTLSGSAGGFSYSSYNQRLEQCPTCYPVHLPLVVR